VQLLQIQGVDSPAESWLHLIRVLRCQNKSDDMEYVIDHVLKAYASDPTVIQEQAALIALKEEISQTKA